MLRILNTREVATKIGKSVRRTQELITEGKVFPRLTVVENGVTRLGVREEVLAKYLTTRKAKSVTR